MPLPHPPAIALRRQMLHIGVILAVGLGLYAASWNNELVWDDRMMLAESPVIADPGRIAEALTTPYLAPLEDVSAPPPYYRPGSLALLMLEHRVFGTVPLGYRLVNTAIHTLNGILVYILALILLRKLERGEVVVERAALLSALVFISLPYNADAVCFLTDLGALLSLAFTLMATLLFQRYLSDGSLGVLLAIPVVTTLGWASKETAIVIPPVLLAYYALLPGRREHRRALLGIGSAALSCVTYLLVRNSVLEHPVGVDLGVAALRIPGDLAVAVRWALAPHPLSLEQPLPVTVGGPTTWIGIILILLAIAATVLLRRRMPVVGYAMISWAITISPHLLISQGSYILPSRHLYIPSAWLAILAGLLALHSGRPVRIAGFGLVGGLALLTLIRIDAWNSALSLWTLEVEQNPQRPYALGQLANALEEAGRIEEAMALNRRAVSLPYTPRESGTVALAHVHLGADRMNRLRDPDGAMRHYKMAAELSPMSVEAWLGVGSIHAKDGDWTKALAAFERVESFLPDHLDTQTAKAGALAALGRYDEALSTLDRAEKIAAGFPEKRADIQRKRAAIKKLQKDRNRAVR